MSDAFRWERSLPTTTSAHRQIGAALMGMGVLAVCVTLPFLVFADPMHPILLAMTAVVVLVPGAATAVAGFRMSMRRAVFDVVVEAHRIRLGDREVAPHALRRIRVDEGCLVVELEDETIRSPTVFANLDDVVSMLSSRVPSAAEQRAEREARRRVANDPLLSSVHDR